MLEATPSRRALRCERNLFSPGPTGVLPPACSLLGAGLLTPVLAPCATERQRVPLRLRTSDTTNRQRWRFSKSVEDMVETRKGERGGWLGRQCKSEIVLLPLPVCCLRAKYLYRKHQKCTKVQFSCTNIAVLRQLDLVQSLYTNLYCILS